MPAAVALLLPHLQGSSLSQGVRFSVQDASCGSEATSTCCRAAAGTQLLPPVHTLLPLLLLPLHVWEADTPALLLHACWPISLQLLIAIACVAVASGRATKLREAQNRLPSAWLRVPHWPARDAAGSSGLNFATNSCKHMQSVAV